MSFSDQYTYNFEYQLDILKVCVQDPEFLRSNPEVVQAKFFSLDHLATVAKIIIRHFNSWREPPGAASASVAASHYFEQFNMPHDRRVVIIDTLHRVYSELPANRDSVKQTISDFARTQAIKDGIGKVLDLVEKGGDLDEVDSIMRRSSMVGVRRRKGVSFFDEVEGLQQRALNDSSYGASFKIPTGFKPIDNATYGGMGAGQIWVVAAKPKGGKCLGPDARVWHPYLGYTRVEDFDVGSEISCSVGETDNSSGVVPILAKASNGVKNVFDVHLRSGRVLRQLTGNHPIRGVTEYVCVEDLRVGDAVAAPGTLQLLSYRPWDIPKLGYTIGAFLGDGSMLADAAIITQAAEENSVVDMITSVCPPEWGIEASRTGTCVRLVQKPTYLGSRPKNRKNKLTEWLRSADMMGKGAAEKHIPDIVWKGGEETAVYVLAGLWDTDGSMYSKNSTSGVAEYTTVSKRLADDVLTLLHTLGIYAQIKQKGKTSAWNVTVFGRQNLRKFLERIPIVVPHKISALQRLCGKKSACIEKGMYYDRLPTYFRKFMPAGMRKDCRISKDLFRTHVSGSSHEFALSCHWDEVVEVSPAGRMETYDLQSSPESQSFVTEGILVHNTTLMVNMASMALYKGLKVFHYSFGDMNETDVLMKYAQKFGNTTVNSILESGSHKSWCHDVKKVAPGAHLEIVYESPGVMDCGMLYADIGFRSSRLGFSPDLVVIDYANKMKMGRSDNTYMSMSEIYGGLKELGDAYDCAVLTGVQMKRESDRGKGSPEDISQSWLQVADADAIIIINQNESEKDSCSARLSLPIVRRGSEVRDIKVSFHPEYGRFEVKRGLEA